MPTDSITPTVPRAKLALRLTKTFLFVILLYVPTGLALYFFVNDLIAVIVTASLALWVLASFLMTISQALTLRGNDGALLSAPGEDNLSYANSPTTLILTIPPFSLLPGWSLELTPFFARGAVTLPRCLITGQSTEERRIPLVVTFPHRGEWETSVIKYVIRDPFGMLIAQWSKSLASQITVYPPPPEGKPFPVLTSTHRPGDELTDQHNREGDLFDLKAYDPADGARRIVWKVFARRRELISRHPEAAMSPEGRVVIFGMLSRFDDITASEIVYYLRRLEDLGIEIFFSCAGQGKLPIARTADQALTLLIDTVWSCHLPDTLERIAETNALLNSAAHVDNRSTIERLIVFSSESTLRTGEGQSLATALHDLLRSKQGHAVFFIPQTAHSSREHSKPPSPFERFLLMPTKEDSHRDSRSSEGQVHFSPSDWDVVSL